MLSIDRATREGELLYQRIHRYRNRIRNNSIKLERGCDQCGFNLHHVALDWDHVDRNEKTQRVAYMVGRSYGWDTIQAEISKCQLLCANCHRIKTHTEGDYSAVD